ncbi:MAG TPA: hypothetical protein PKA16_15610 [Ottowia sp.]|uniref:hypothetical protein n=1 Tax=Ottowia sp. TaxID=1898956 RepID=UPI002C04B728|nr:hypothetical protein [Ottowia sp.]HMN22801.1 hypothetical protein [Ottowia sp.]
MTETNANCRWLSGKVSPSRLPPRPNRKRSRPPRAPALKGRRSSIPLFSSDLTDIQVKALEEGVPCQTLIASVLHKYVTGRLTQRPVPGGPSTTSRGDPG